MENKKYDLKNINDPDVRLAFYMQELFDGFCSNRGLQYLMDRAREQFGRPLVLYDSSCKVLAASNDIKSILQFSEDLNGNRYLSEDDISFVRANNITEALQTNRSLGTIANDRPLQGTLLTSIKIDIIEVAQLAVYEAGDQFQDIDFLLINKVGAILSAQLQRSILLNLDHNQLPSYILVDLVEGNPIDASILNNKQLYLKWARTEYLYILVICGGKQEVFDSKISVVFQTVKSYIPIEQCIIYRSSIVTFIDQTLYEALFKEQGNAFHKFIVNNDLYVGISQKYSLLTESKKQYQNAVKALEIGHKRKINCSLFDACTLHIITELVSSKYDLMDFCHPAVAMLKTYDEENGSALLNTLKQYIFYSSSPTDAARVLNIHRNTLFYRIGKIKDMTGIKLEYGDEISKIFLSIRLLEVKGDIA